MIDKQAVRQSDADRGIDKQSGSETDKVIETEGQIHIQAVRQAQTE